MNTTNILFFMTVQIFFYWFIASRQIDNVCASKAKILVILREQMQREGRHEEILALDAAVLGAAEQKRLMVENERKQRDQANKTLIRKWILPPIIVATLLIIGLVGYNHTRRYPFTFAHKFGLCLVLLAYVTEIFFYVFVVRPYVMVSDSDILCGVTGLAGKADNNECMMKCALSCSSES